MKGAKYKFIVPDEAPIGTPIPFSAEKLPVGDRTVQVAVTGRAPVFSVTDEDGGNKKTGTLEGSFVLDMDLPDGTYVPGTTQTVSLWNFVTRKLLATATINVTSE